MSRTIIPADVLEIRKEGRLFTDPQPGDASREPPRIVIEE
jgi:hypothetical protein